MFTQEEYLTKASIMTRAQLARYLDLDEANVRTWSRASGERPAVITQGLRGFGPQPPTIPLLGIGEAAAMRSLVESRGKTPRAAASLIRTVKADDPLAFGRQGFFTDGTDVFRKYEHGFERLKDRQQALEDVLRGYLKELRFEGELLDTFIAHELKHDRVLVNPRYAAGRPYLESTGTPVFVILDELREGARDGEVAEEHDLPLEVVRDVRKKKHWLADVA